MDGSGRTSSRNKILLGHSTVLYRHLDWRSRQTRETRLIVKPALRNRWTGNTTIHASKNLNTDVMDFSDYINVLIFVVLAPTNPYVSRRRIHKLCFPRISSANASQADYLFQLLYCSTIEQ